MNLIPYCVNQIKLKISPEIVQEAFAPRKYDPSRRERTRDNQLGLNIDALIRKHVIDGRVAIDVNLCSGMETTIRLTGLQYEAMDPWNLIYRIPNQLTGGRLITHVYSLHFGEGNIIGANRMAMQGSSPLLEAAAGVFMAQAPLPAVQSPYVTLIGDNTVLVSDAQALPGVMYLRCMLQHEPNFANLPSAYYKKFSELCVLAAKAWIWTNLVIPLDEGLIKAGSTINRFREIVDSFQDADQMYEDFLRDKWRVSGVMADKEKYRRVLRMTVGGRR